MAHCLNNAHALQANKDNLTWRERDLDDGADAGVATDDLELVEDLREQLVDQLHEAERAVDLPQLGGRDVGLQLVALAYLHRSIDLQMCARASDGELLYVTFV